MPSFPTIELEPYQESWLPDDPHANFKHDVALYTKTDPLPTLQGLSAATGIPVGSLVRYVLVTYAASRADALLALPPIVFQQMQQQISQAEAAGTPQARLAAYEALRQIVAWLDMDATE